MRYKEVIWPWAKGYTDDDAWEILYKANGISVADWLNDFFPLPDGEWRSTRYGEAIWIKWDEYGETTHLFSRWDLWRQEVSYYFGELASCFNEFGWKWDKGLPIASYLILSVVLQHHAKFAWEIIEREAEILSPEGSEKFLLL